MAVVNSESAKRALGMSEPTPSDASSTSDSCEKFSTSSVGPSSPKPPPPPLPKNANAIQLSNAGIQALKLGNLPYAFRCVNAAAKMIMHRRMVAANKRSGKGVRRGKASSSSSPFTMVTRSQASARINANTAGASRQSAASRRAADSALSKRATKAKSPSSGFRFDWMDCTKTYQAVKRYAESNGHRTRKPGGLGTEFLCLRFILVVPTGKRNGSKKILKSDEDECSWVVFYNTALVFHLVAEQRGEYGSALLPKSQALWQMAGAEVTRMIDETSPKDGSSTASSSSMSQWHMARLIIWNNLAALFHERSMLAEATKMTRLVSGHVAGRETLWHDDNQWSGNEWQRDSWLCRLLLTHALSMGGCHVAGAA